MEVIGTWVDTGVMQAHEVAIAVIAAHSRRPIEADVTPTKRRRTIEVAGVEEVVWI